METQPLPLQSSKTREKERQVTRQLQVLQEYGEEAVYLGGLPGGSDIPTLIPEDQIGVDQAKMRRKECYRQRENSMPEA